MNNSLKVAIVHYHLRTGGVARVIYHTLAALHKHDVRIAVLSGEDGEATGYPDVTMKVMPELMYATAQLEDPEVVAAGMMEAATAILGGQPDLWHFHNHALGANPTLSETVSILAGQGQRLLLHIHDFPEDGRPANYNRLLKTIGHDDPQEVGRKIYPRASHVHYAVLNSRDRNHLIAAGLPEQNLHLLPNPIAFDDINDTSPLTPYADAKATRTLIYPTTAIRRKNLGEFILWSTVGSEEFRFAITRAPQNRLYYSAYKRWVNFARQHQLPVDFEVSDSSGATISELIRSSHAAVTTSVAEGFGLGFLEPWLLNRSVVGRNLPEVTTDFEKLGINLSNLYRQLLVPLEWIGRGNFEQAIRQALARLRNAYGLDIKPSDVNMALEASLQDDRVDFARLNESLQERICVMLTQSGSARTELEPSSLEATLSDDQVIEANATLIRDNFSVEKYGKKLVAIYNCIGESPTGTPDALDARKILDSFLSPERFMLLRT